MSNEICSMCGHEDAKQELLCQCGLIFSNDISKQKGGKIVIEPCPHCVVDVRYENSELKFKIDEFRKCLIEHRSPINPARVLFNEIFGDAQ